MPEFADIWPHFFWRFFHTIFKPIIKHSRITMQKKAITIGKPHYRPQICKLESKRSQQKESACILNVLLFNIQALFRFCDYSNSRTQIFKIHFAPLLRWFFCAFYVVYTFLLLRGRESIGSHFCSLHNRIPIFLSNTQYAFFGVLHVYLRRRRKSPAPQGIQRRQPASP